jgi:hypothetical protein
MPIFADLERQGVLVQQTFYRSPTLSSSLRNRSICHAVTAELRIGKLLFDSPSSGSREAWLHRHHRWHIDGQITAQPLLHLDHFIFLDVEALRQQFRLGVTLFRFFFFCRLKVFCVGRRFTMRQSFMIANHVARIHHTA